MQVTILENIYLALDNLKQHPLRSLLTILSVVIGTMTIIVMTAFISGIQVSVAKEIESFGSNVVYIYRYDAGLKFDISREERMRAPLSYEDALAIGRECPSVIESVPLLSPINFEDGPRATRIPIRYQNIEMVNATVSACLPGYFQMGTCEILEGRYFTDAEDQHRADVVVIGRDVANTLFPNSSALDKEIQINNRNYRIVGVLAPRDTLLVGNEDPNNENKSVRMPYQSLRKIYPELKDNLIIAQAKPGKLFQATEEIRQLLRHRRKVAYQQPDNFNLQTSDEIMTRFEEITAGTFLLMLAISSVGLLVGGIGVMNIMLVSVTERTKEIGVRKAIGARFKDIVVQFIFEAAMLTGLGGLIGIISGFAISELIKSKIPADEPAWAPIVGLTFSVMVGIIFGFWPAWRAGRLDAIVSLRYE